MARTAVTVTAMTPNTVAAFVAGTTGTTIDATNHHVITPPAGCPVEELLVIVTNTTASTKAATVKAGDNPPAFEAGQGDLAISLTDGSTTPQSGAVVLQSGRFVQDDGTINIDIAASMTGKITCFRIPRTA
ncbi:MAG: hypothetical protein AB7H43_10745 [Acidimicrobiia bacterium]